MQPSNRFNENLVNNERSHQHVASSFQTPFSPKLPRKNELPEPQNGREKADEFKRETDLIDLTKAVKDDDLFSADIDFMNNYLNSLPDYSKMSTTSPKQYNPSTVRLREHPTPKPFYTTVNDYNSRNPHKAPVPQSPKSQRKQINPLSKSNSIHTISKRNLGQSIEKETFADEQKNKISRSTSSTTIPAKETSDLMGFMRKPSSLMNIFKKLGSQNPPPPPSMQPKPLINNNNNNVVRNVVNNKTPSTSMSRTKNISDFWNENLQQQNAGNNKFGWNYQKIIPNTSPKQLHEVQKQAPSSNLVVVKKLETIEPSKPAISNLTRMTPNEMISQQTPHHHHHHHHTHSQPFPKAPSQSMHNFVKKLTESPKLQRSPRVPMHNNDLEHEQKLLKSSSNSHIYMNQDDPNYFKNLHKITKSLDNATNNIICNNKSSYKRSMSNTSVPSYLGSSPQSHVFYPPNQPPMMMMHPSSAPMNFYPPISYKPPQDFHLPQRSNSKSNIPLCYKYPLNRSSSNTSMMTNYNGTAVGFYNVQDPLVWQTTPALHQNLINKSSSSSCIYAKTLSQPTHLSKNNDIFAKYKPIVSDDEESESEDDDISKHSKGSLTSGNRVPAPAPFKKQPQTSTSNYPPFTKLNSIQIPINGQLPSAFKNSNNSIDTQPKSEGIVDPNPASRKNSLIISSNNNKPLQMTSSSAPILKNSCNQSSNIFYNFMNPMAATQTQSVNQMHLLQQNESVGCYTPYTKYLSDRKYFDVAMHDGMNVVSGGTKPEQRRTSKIPTLSEQQKAKPTVAEPKSIATKLCDIKDEEKKTCSELAAAAVVPANNNTTQTSTENVVDPKEILSAFDPYFIEDPQPSTSNKLHQLLTTVANEWNSSCDHAMATAPSVMMSNCKAYQGDRYGSGQYEVVKMKISSLLLLPLIYGLTHKISIIA